MPEAKVQELRLEMQRAEAQRLQPHHIQSFFIEAFEHLGGRLKKREEGRYEITHVPVRIRERDRLIGIGAPVQKKYERICFEKSRINQQPVATRSVEHTSELKSLMRISYAVFCVNTNTKNYINSMCTIDL